MSGIMPPPIFQKAPRWDDRHCTRAQDRFYEQFGHDWFAGWKTLRKTARRLRAWAAVRRRKSGRRATAECRTAGP